MQHGIDLKTHSQCQRGAKRANTRPCLRMAGTVFLIFCMACAGQIAPFEPRSGENGGAYRDRTDDPLLAKQVLSQLS